MAKILDLHLVAVAYGAIITIAVSLVVNGAKCNSSLYNVTEPAVAGGVHAFVSQSWYDDAEDKWRKLSACFQLFQTSE